LAAAAIFAKTNGNCGNIKRNFARTGNGCPLTAGATPAEL
jgi:hypothetical protein